MLSSLWQGEEVSFQSAPPINEKNDWELLDYAYVNMQEFVHCLEFSTSTSMFDVVS